MEYRAFFFGHFQLSSIQQGIQAGHCQRELALKYLTRYTKTSSDIYSLWAEEHLTVVLKNGGNSKCLKDIVDTFLESDHVFPWTEVRESVDAMDGLLTCVSIVLPSIIYDRGVNCYRDKSLKFSFNQRSKLYSVKDKSNPPELLEFTTFEYYLIELLVKTRLAT